MFAGSSNDSEDHVYLVLATNKSKNNWVVDYDYFTNQVK